MLEVGDLYVMNPDYASKHIGKRILDIGIISEILENGIRLRSINFEDTSVLEAKDDFEKIYKYIDNLKETTYNLIYIPSQHVAFQNVNGKLERFYIK